MSNEPKGRPMTIEESAQVLASLYDSIRDGNPGAAVDARTMIAALAVSLNVMTVATAALNVIAGEDYAEDSGEEDTRSRNIARLALSMLPPLDPPEGTTPVNAIVATLVRADCATTDDEIRARAAEARESSPALN